MGKSKRKIFSLVLAVLMLVGTVSGSAYAAGSISGVNYTMIDTTGSRVTLELGGLSFEGQLSKGRILSDSEKDKIIKQVMNEMDLSVGMLENAQYLIDEAKKQVGITDEDLNEAIRKVTGMQDLIDLYKYVMGNEGDPGVKTNAQMAQDMLKSEVMGKAEDALEDIVTHGGKVAVKGVSKFAYKLIFILPDLLDAGLNLYGKFEKSLEIYAIGIDREIKLIGFYEECNNRIREASGEGGAYYIRFNDPTQTYNCTFWEAGGNMMEAKLSGTLEKTLGGEGDGFGGTYSGTLTLTMESVDLSPAESNLINSKGLEKFRNALKQAGGFKQTGNSGKKTKLKRTVSGDVSVTIDEISGKQTVKVDGSLNSGTDDTEFNLDRTLTFQRVNMSTTNSEIRCTSTDVNSVSFSADSVSSFGSHTETGAGSATGEQEPGTVWKPLESTPKLEVYGR
ncbi:MAG: hypothetical protein Q4B67_00205 [Eubacteriales bacterium]|nr:hypothetical protein [Eubacteriales bacterium]